MTIAADIANALGAKGAGPRWVARCPAHNDRSPSLSIGTGQNGRLLLNCFTGCSFEAIVAALLQEHGLRLDHSRQVDRCPDRPAPCPPAPMIVRPDKIVGILRLALPLYGTPGERYFRTRGCALPTGDAVHYLAPSEECSWPTVAAVITDFATGAPMSMHFTMLNRDGTSKAPIKQPRRLLAGHRKQGGVIRLTMDADVTTELGLGEGIETCLAVAKTLGPLRPIWSAIDAGNLSTLPVLPGIERLLIYADTDVSGTGQAAARKLAQRWHQAGREVFIAQPPALEGGKADWNDRTAA